MLVERFVESSQYVQGAVVRGKDEKVYPVEL